MLKNSKYYKFIQEHHGAELFEDDKCFMTYSVRDGIFYINDVYLEPEFRTVENIQYYGNILFTQAKEMNCKKIHGFADKLSLTPNKSKALFRLLGFTKVSSTDDFNHYERDV